MALPSPTTSGIYPANNEVNLKLLTPSDDHGHDQCTIELHAQHSLDTQMSEEGARIMAEISPRVTVTFHNISKIIDIPAKMTDPTSKERVIPRTLLDNVAGQIHPGQIAAIMGPSGSGKTTLLDTLAGRGLNGVTGNIWFNNQRYEKSMKRKLAYVLQQDLFFENLTVKQQLTYTALLRLPNELSKHDKLAQVEQVIDQLRIRKCANTPILLISGGEKKRVNIATEFLANPSVIFLDEPTSGLDSTSAVSLIDVLRELANQGKTIITSIHQPSSQIFQSFDQLILLADGKTIFMGKPTDALAYFATLGYNSPAQYNPADYIMDLVNQDMKVREELKEAYQLHKISIDENDETKQLDKLQSQFSTKGRQYLIAEPNGDESELPITSNGNLISKNGEGKWPIGFFAQLMILCSRSFRLTGKNQFTPVNFIQALGLAIICGICWLRMELTEKSLVDRSTFLFFIMTFWPFHTLMGGLLSFPFERAVIDKERASGSYRLLAYFVAKSLSEVPLKLVLPTLFLIITYWMANFNPSFVVFLGVIFFQLLVVLVAESIGLFLGAACKNLSQAITAAVLFLLGLMLVGGFFVRNVPQWLSVWAKWLSFFKYAYDACFQLQFMGESVYHCTDGSLIERCHNNRYGTFTAKDALSYYNFGIDMGWNCLVLLGMFIVYRSMAYLSLRFVKDKSGRT